MAAASATRRAFSDFRFEISDFRAASSAEWSMMGEGEAAALGWTFPTADAISKPKAAPRIDRETSDFMRHSPKTG
jgi:hypothetical protein